MRGNEQDVVERQCFPGGTHVTFSYAQKRIIPASPRPENLPADADNETDARWPTAKTASPV
jgi:hypothetical protein